LADTADFLEFSEYEGDGLLHTAIRILFKPLILCLDIANGGGHHEFSSSGFFIAGLDGALTQQFELVFVQAAFRLNSKRSLLWRGA